MTHIVVVGAGQAAVSLLAKLRMLGFDGELTLIGDEVALPYQRPALSKKYLLGEMTAERLQLRPLSFYHDQRIALRFGTPVTSLDLEARCLTVGGETVRFDKLALTTGSLLRRFPAQMGGDLAGIYGIRSLADVDALAPQLVEGRRVLVIGGGYIGLEAAAVAAKKGLRVTLVEMADRILARVACAETATYFRELHQRWGVTVLEGKGIARLSGTDHVSGALLTDGTTMDVDFVIAGVGVLPATALAEAVGIHCDNGVAVDERGRTSAPYVWAAGDCTSFPWRGSRIRLECVQNAVEQAETVAADMLDQGQAYEPVPWFWSDQYHTKLQIAGLNTGYTQVVSRDAGGSGRSYWYFRNDQFCAVDAMDDPRAYMVGRQLLQSGRSPDPKVVADANADVKSLLK